MNVLREDTKRRTILLEIQSCHLHQLTQTMLLPHFWLCHSHRHSKPEDHWSCIAHLSAEDMLKSVVIEEKKFKHSPWAGADNSLRPKFLCQQKGLITMVICCKFKKSRFNLTLYTSLHDLTNVYSCRSWADNP